MELYVSNLAYEVEDNELFEAFSQFGTVRKATVVKDRETNRSRGFGFVDMPDGDAGARAVQEMDGVNLQGRPLRVSEARPRPERERPSFGAPRPGGDRRPPGGAPYHASGPRPSFAGGGDRPSGRDPRSDSAPYRGPGRPMPRPGAPPSRYPPSPGPGGPRGRPRGERDNDSGESDDKGDPELAAVQEDKERRARKFASGGPKKRPGPQRGGKGRKRKFDDGPGPQHTRRATVSKKRLRQAFPLDDDDDELFDDDEQLDDEGQLDDDEQLDDEGQLDVHDDG